MNKKLTVRNTMEVTKTAVETSGGMTWGELKSAMETLGVKDRDSIEINLSQEILQDVDTYQWWDVRGVDAGFKSMRKGRQSVPVFLEMGEVTGDGGPAKGHDDIRSFDLERVSTTEFILADIDHAQMLHDYCVEVVNIGKPANSNGDQFRVMIHSEEDRRWLIVQCENAGEVLGVLGMGQGLCQPHFVFSVAQYFEDFFDTSFTLAETEVWASYLMG